jgi:hypothetical protein
MQRSNITTRINKIIVIMGLSLSIGVGCVPTSTPAQPTATQPTMTQSKILPTPTSQPKMTPTKIFPTPTSQPLKTPLPPTDEPEAKDLEYVVPPGTEAIIDGVLSEDEWKSAFQIDLVDEGQIFLMYAGGYLFLGIRAKPEPVTSICVDQAEQVSILHSSAAIGTAVYLLGDGVWEQIRGFEWCCRETTDSSQAQEARRTHLLQEGWIASNGRMGNPDEVEYQIAMPEGSLRLAVTSIGSPNYRSVLSWPEDLSGDCSRLEMLTGPIPEQAQFSVEDWMTITVSTD